MTEKEAIKILKKDSCYECAQGAYSPLNCEYGECRVSKATRVAIKALEEVQQYRTIGTPEECRAAVEKQTAKKPPVVNRPSIFVKVPVCPNCSTPEHYQPLYGKTKYCSNCGQKLDWSDEE